jgi:hypothetical protein
MRKMVSMIVMVVVEPTELRSVPLLPSTLIVTSQSLVPCVSSD